MDDRACHFLHLAPRKQTYSRATVHERLKPGVEVPESPAHGVLYGDYLNPQEHLKAPRELKYCTNCERLWSGEVNTALNMQHIAASCVVRGEDRPPHLTHPLPPAVPHGEGAGRANATPAVGTIAHTVAAERSRLL